MSARVAFLLSLWAAAACQPMANTAGNAADATRRAVRDTESKWNHVFSYEKPKPAQLPQSRYCYKMQSDVVCYDSPQEQTSARLTGYQDGAAISAFQPGGGSLGISGGEATAGYDTPYLESPGDQPVQLKALGNVAESVDTSPAMGAAPNPAEGPMAAAPGAPFHVRESPYQKGAVVVKDVPAPAAAP